MSVCICAFLLTFSGGPLHEHVGERWAYFRFWEIKCEAYKRDWVMSWLPSLDRCRCGSVRSGPC